MDEKALNDKILAKFRLLPGEKQQQIKAKCKISDESFELAKAIRLKLLPIGFRDPGNTTLGFRPWLGDSDNLLFLPFVWDQFSVGEENGLDSKLRIGFAQAIANLLKINSESESENDWQKVSLRENLYFANFNQVDLSKASLWQANLINAIFDKAIFGGGFDLTQANAEGVDFTSAIALTDRDIYQLSLRSLYRVKFKLQDQKDPYELRGRVIFTYAKKLAVLHNLDQTKAQNLLVQIELSGFSPFQWAFEEEKFNQQFDALKNAAPIDHAALLQTIKDKILSIVPKKNLLQGRYYQNRLNTEGPDSWKPIFAKNPRGSRTTQIAELQKIAEYTEFSSAVGKLIEVKTQIEQEWNIWNSELLKQIKDVIQEASLSTKPAEKLLL